MELDPGAVPQQTAVQTAVSQVQADFPERGASSLPLTTGGGKPRERQKKWKGEEEKGIKENTVQGVQGLHRSWPTQTLHLESNGRQADFPIHLFYELLNWDWSPKT